MDPKAKQEGISSISMSASDHTEAKGSSRMRFDRRSVNSDQRRRPSEAPFGSGQAPHQAAPDRRKTTRSAGQLKLPSRLSYSGGSHRDRRLRSDLRRQPVKQLVGQGQVNLKPYSHGGIAGRRAM